MFLTSAAYTVNASVLEPIVDAISSNVGVLAPVGITIMGIIISVRIIPRIVHMFM